MGYPFLSLSLSAPHPRILLIYRCEETKQQYMGNRVRGSVTQIPRTKNAEKQTTEKA